MKDFILSLKKSFHLLPKVSPPIIFYIWGKNGHIPRERQLFSCRRVSLVFMLAHASRNALSEKGSLKFITTPTSDGHTWARQELRLTHHHICNTHVVNLRGS